MMMNTLVMLFLDEQILFIINILMDLGENFGCSHIAILQLICIPICIPMYLYIYIPVMS